MELCHVQLRCTMCRLTYAVLILPEQVLGSLASGITT